MGLYHGCIKWRLPEVTEVVPSFSLKWRPCFLPDLLPVCAGREHCSRLKCLFVLSSTLAFTYTGRDNCVESYVELLALENWECVVSFLLDETASEGCNEQQSNHLLKGRWIPQTPWVSSLQFHMLWISWVWLQRRCQQGSLPRLHSWKTDELLCHRADSINRYEHKSVINGQIWCGSPLAFV